MLHSLLKNFPQKISWSASSLQALHSLLENFPEKNIMVCFIASSASSASSAWSFYHLKRLKRFIRFYCLRLVMWTIRPFLLHRFIASSASFASKTFSREKHHSPLHRFKRFIRFYKIFPRKISWPASSLQALHSLLALEACYVDILAIFASSLHRFKRFIRF